MKVLFDQGTPVPLRRQLVGHTIDTVYEQGWATLSNGLLLATAEQAAYELLITTDKNLRYQQNLGGRRLAILSSARPRGRAYGLMSRAFKRRLTPVRPGAIPNSTSSPPRKLPIGAIAPDKMKFRTEERA